MKREKERIKNKAIPLNDGIDTVPNASLRPAWAQGTERLAEINMVWESVPRRIRLIAAKLWESDKVSQSEYKAIERWRKTASAKPIYDMLNIRHVLDGAIKRDGTHDTTQAVNNRAKRIISAVNVVAAQGRYKEATKEEMLRVVASRIQWDTTYSPKSLQTEVRRIWRYFRQEVKERRNQVNVVPDYRVGHNAAALGLENLGQYHQS